MVPPPFREKAPSFTLPACRRDHSLPSSFDLAVLSPKENRRAALGEFPMNTGAKGLATFLHSDDQSETRGVCTMGNPPPTTPRESASLRRPLGSCGVCSSPLPLGHSVLVKEKETAVCTLNSLAWGRRGHHRTPLTLRSKATPKHRESAPHFGSASIFSLVLKPVVRRRTAEASPLRAPPTSGEQPHTLEEERQPANTAKSSHHRISALLHIFSGIASQASTSRHLCKTVI